MKGAWLGLLAIVAAWLVLCYFVFMWGFTVGQHAPCMTDMECEMKCGVQI